LFRVSNAVKTVNNLLENQKEPIYTYGPIIHNAQVVDLFTSKGVKKIDDIDEAEPTVIL